MSNLLKWSAHDYDLGYIYARGYYDGRSRGDTDMDKSWMTDEEQNIFNAGYDRGVSDYYKDYEEGETL